MNTNQTTAEARRAVLRLRDVEQGLANLANHLAALDRRLADLEARLTDSTSNPIDQGADHD